MKLSVQKPVTKLGITRTVSRVFVVKPFGVPAGIPPSAFGEKGGLLGGTGVGTYLDLPPGTDGEVLTANAAQTTGLEWAPAPTTGNANLTNKSGSDLVAYDVVVIDPANDNAFKTTTTEADATVTGVLAENIANDAVGQVAVSPRPITINVQGNVTRGHYLVTSTTAGRAKDGGATSAPGTFARALTGYAGGAAGQVSAILLIGGAPTVAAQIWLSGRGALAPITDGFTTPVQIELSTNKQNFALPSFPAGATKYAEWEIAMPSDWDGGTITAKFHWMANSTSTNSAIFGLAGRAYADDDALDQAYGTAKEVTDANKSTAYDLNITADTAAITIGGTPVAGQMVKFRAHRLGTGSDNLAVAALLIGIQITYARL